MFQSKTKEKNESATATIIGKGTVINGDINTDGDIRIDGMLNGNILAACKIIIGHDGMVNGNITGDEADVLGKTIGNIRIKGLLFLRNKASVTGDIYAEHLQVEPSASFNGNCKMGASVVEINADKSSAVNF